MRRASFRQTTIALVLALGVSLLASVRQVREHGYLSLNAQTDFSVYYTAAGLISDHLGGRLYDEAASGVDPQRRQAGAGTVFAQEAKRRGIAKVDLYVYPPILAQILRPFSRLRIRDALLAWRLTNCCFILLVSMCLSYLLPGTSRRYAVPALLLGMLSFSPLWQALHYGQVTLVLLGLISLGVLLQFVGWQRASAFALAVAALIKLTPLLLLLPMLVWREWRWARWFAGTLLLGLIASYAGHELALIVTFFLHVVPPMSRGIISRENQTILSAVEMMWCRGRNSTGLVVPTDVIAMGRVLSLLVLAVGIGAIWPGQGDPTAGRKVDVLFSFALLSLCIAPVAWIDTLIFAYPLLVRVWARLYRRMPLMPELLLVFGCSAGLGAALAFRSLPRLSSVTSLQYVPLLSAIVLAMYVLFSARSDEQATRRGSRVAA